MEFLRAVEEENSEENFQRQLANYNTNLIPYYKAKGETDVFVGQKEIPISCRFFRAQNCVAKVIIVTGYNESYFKYIEFIHDLHRLNISVYCYDHRGQGFSGRFLNQGKRGCIDSFSYLVEDLSTLFKKVEADDNVTTPVTIIAHSMGGCIAAQALSENKISPNKMILLSPMFEVRLTPLRILETPIYYLSQFVTAMGFEKSYAISQQDCIPFLPFDTNDVTHSKFRFLTWRKHISEIQQLQLGGVTFGWLAQSIKASKKLRKQGINSSIPIHVFQAREDTVVVNEAQNEFISKSPSAKKVVIDNARHELLLEVDFIRNKVMEIIIDKII